MRVLVSLFLVLLLVPGWSGEERLQLLGPAAQVWARPVPLDPGDQARRRVGRLTFLGGVALSSPDRAFGGFSALSVRGDRFTLLSDGGNLVRFRMGSDWRPHALRFGALPGGPGIGWTKLDRDSESLTVDPDTGRAWVGFEVHNQIWRYTPGFAAAEGGSAPPAMQGWPQPGGPESLARLRDGRFVVIAESKRTPGDGRVALVFGGDPVRDPRAAFAFRYRPARGFSPVDLAELPDGRFIVLERRFRLPFRWSTRVALIARGAIRPGASVAGETLAMLRAPLLHDNFEGVAVAREGGATMLWLVSDDNQLWPFQHSFLLKFRLDDESPAGPGPGGASKS